VNAIGELDGHQQDQERGEQEERLEEKREFIHHEHSIEGERASPGYPERFVDQVSAVFEVGERENQGHARRRDVAEVSLQRGWSP
jgi:hypothetical protein